MGFGVVDLRSQVLSRLLLVGRVVRAHLSGDYVRDEGLQARELTAALALLDGAGVDGAFAMTFVEQLMTRSEDPRFDLDMSAMSLVSTLPPGQHGTTYPDMPWEPKEAFRAMARAYAADGIAGHG
jgi:hypothetical protein